MVKVPCSLGVRSNIGTQALGLRILAIAYLDERLG